MLKILGEDYGILPRKGEPVNGRDLHYLREKYGIYNLRLSGNERNPRFSTTIRDSSVTLRLDEFQRELLDMGYEMVGAVFRHPQIITYAIKKGRQLIAIFGYFPQANGSFFSTRVVERYTHPNVLNASADALGVPATKDDAPISRAVIAEINGE